MDQDPPVTPTNQTNNTSETPQNPPQPQPTPQPELNPWQPQDAITGPKKGKRGKLPIILGLIVILIIAGLLGWHYRKHYSYSTPKPSTPSVSTPVGTVNNSVVSANNTFGMGVFDQLIQQTPQTNIFISPASIAMALSMVYNGAEGSTQTAMQQTLDYQGLSTNAINASNLALLSRIKNPDPKVTLSIANSAWLKQGFPIKQSFIHTVQTDYQAQATTLNFQSPTAPTTINSWVSNATQGKIPTIVSTIPSDEVLYLINAVYFKGSWHTKFDPSATQNQAFTTGTGSKVQVPLMSNTDSYNYYQDNTVQSIELPYGNNQRLSMDVFLPTNLTSFLKGLTYSQLTAIESKYSQSQGTILLPKFTLSYATSLNTTLKNLGMGEAFGYGANFDNIAKNTYISDVEHKTFIAVDEQGTTAAAATSVGVGDAAAVASGFTMQVDKPFVFTIQDNATKDVLFIGVIDNPTQ